MSSPERLSITLTPEQTEFVRKKVESGQYASEDEVLEAGLDALVAPNERFEQWLREEVGPAYDAHMADPSSAISGDQLSERLQELYDSAPE